jgi:hypothetical protein
MKRLSAQTIDNELVVMLGPDAIGYSTVSNYLCQRNFPSTFRQTIAWNPLGFPLIVALPKGRTFNAECCRDNILEALIQLRREDDRRKLVVYIDKIRVHTAQNCRIFAKECLLGTELLNLSGTPYSWNADEVSQLLNRREWIVLKSIKNCLINSDRRWFLGGSQQE